MSFKSLVWKERLSQWKMARQNWSCRSGSESEKPDIRDRGFLLGNQKSSSESGSKREFIDTSEYVSSVNMEIHRVELDDEIREPLSRKVPISSTKINPFRVSIFFRFVILVFFLHYRLTHPVKNAHALWLVSVLCEIWFALFWMLDQLPKWQPVSRETYPDRLSFRYNLPGKKCELAFIDVFVAAFESKNESALLLANTILSILSVDYPSEKLCCYVSDDGASLLTLETLLETCEFARKWVPFCKKFNIEPLSPECYFSQKVDYLKYNTFSTFSKERRLMKRLYEEFKVRINGLVIKYGRVPFNGLKMKDGTPWPGNNTNNHPGMIQILFGRGGVYDNDCEKFPRLVYISREKRPDFKHNKNAGSMNALVRVSALLTNGAYILNLDCNQYINNSRALIEAMCFMMDPITLKKVCYIQFPHRFDGIDANDRYVNHNTVFYNMNLKGLDGIQGPLCFGTGCIFSRKALYGYDPPSKLKHYRKNRWGSQIKSSNDTHSYYSSTLVLDEDSSSLLVMERGYLETEFPSVSLSLEMCFGQSPIFLASILVGDDRFSQSTTHEEILREAIQVISCDYEENTGWGREIGWLYGSHTEGILTGLKMHARGWRSIYCSPARVAFRQSVPIQLSDRLSKVYSRALGSIEILFSRHCPIWCIYGGHLKWLQRVAYLNAILYPLTSIPMLIYSTLPAVCLLSGKFIIPKITSEASIWLILLLLSVFANIVLEIRWNEVGIENWWRNRQFWVTAGISSHLFAVLQGSCGAVLRLFICSRSRTKSCAEGSEVKISKVRWTSLLILPITITLVNLIAMAVGISYALGGAYASWTLQFIKLLFTFLVIIHLYPFLKGVTSQRHQIPTILVVWSLLLAFLFSLLWINVNPFTTHFHGPSKKDCGIQC